MDYKEKYEQALDRAKKELDTCGSQDCEAARQIFRLFPELKESEDERMKNTAIRACKYMIDNFENSTKDYEDAVAWLEKQKTSEEALQYLRENHSSSEMSDFQAAMNIAVAKAYDKGYNDGLEKQNEQNPVIPKFKVGDIIKEKGLDETYEVIKYIDNGFAFIDKYGEIFTAYYDDDSLDYYEIVERKSVEWSEQDETGLGDALWCCEQAASIAKDENDMGSVWYAENWLKSLKDRVQPQPKSDWSEDDENHIQHISDFIMRNRVGDTDAVYRLEQDVNWLLSLKDRYTWKPSDLQIKALEYYTKIGCVDKEGFFGSELVKLLEELKKL